MKVRTAQRGCNPALVMRKQPCGGLVNICVVSVYFSYTRPTLSFCLMACFYLKLVTHRAEEITSCRITLRSMETMRRNVKKIGTSHRTFQNL